MNLKCPKCRYPYSFKEAINDEALTDVIRLSADFAPHARLVWEYAELFDTTRPIKALKLLRVLSEVRDVWTSGSFVFQKARHTISREGMVAAMKLVCGKQFASPIENHNYLKKVMVSISEQEAQKRSIEIEKARREKETRLRNGTRPQETREEFTPMPEGFKQKISKIFSSGEDKDA